MRYALLALMVGSLLPWAARADDYPYEAIVSAEQADALAGPGRRYYATARLPRGTRVEVHARESGGWLAIRPPEGSFSWIPAAQVQLDDDPESGRIAEDGVPSWIGSQVVKVREHKSHIALNRGEPLQILGKKTVPGEDGEDETWYKIAPPTGEFRYIHQRDVSRILPTEEQAPVPPGRLAKSSVSPRNEPAPATIRESGEPAKFAAVQPRELKPLTRQRANISLIDLFQPEPQTVTLPNVGSEITPVGAETGPAPKEPSRPKGPGGDGFQPRKPKQTSAAITPIDRTPASSEPAARIASAPNANIKPLTAAPSATNPPPAATSAKSSPPKSTIDPAHFRRRLDELELELAAMVTTPPATWRLAELRQRVESLVEDGPTPVDRGAARLLLERIHRFAVTFDVEDDPVRSILPGTPVANAAVKPNPETLKPATAAAIADPKYDGQGWLREVLSREKPTAPFAIVDDGGKTVAYVSPAPGLNLKRYEGKKVGLYGQRGVIESLKTPHIVAQRVIDLERHLK